MGILKRLFGKKKVADQIIEKREGQPDVHYIKDENERMNWAMEKARLTFNYFKESVENPNEGQAYFSVKARIEDDGVIEHIWLGEPNFDEEGNVYGIVGNLPTDVTNVKLNEKIGISRKEVSDWMIIDNARLIGGYTIRAIRDGMEGKKLEEFDQSLGMIIDEGEDHFEVNYETPEGALLTLEAAYTNNDLEKAIASKDFFKEAELMLSNMSKVTMDTEIIDKTAEVLKLSFIQHMQENGMPNFKGVKRAFLREFKSEDHCLLTEICTFPDGAKTVDKVNIHRLKNQWKVINGEG